MVFAPEEGYFGFLFGRRKWRLMRLRESVEWEAVWAVLVREVYVLLVSGCVDLDPDVEPALRFWKRDQLVVASTGARYPYRYFVDNYAWTTSDAETLCAGDLLWHCEMSFVNLWTARAMVVDKDPVQLGVSPVSQGRIVMRFVWDWDERVLRQEKWVFQKDPKDPKGGSKASSSGGWTCSVVHELSLADIAALPAEDMPRYTYDQLMAITEERCTTYLEEDARLVAQQQDVRAKLAQFETMGATPYVLTAQKRLRELDNERKALEHARRMVFYRMRDLNLLEEDEELAVEVAEPDPNMCEKKDDL